jgi:acyl phosphate:glycerol-3-phosphate acyltransferase
MADLLTGATLFLLAYVIGSIPFGVVVSRILGTVDPRTAGSRNVGFTNVLRVGGKQAGFLTLAGDLGKGWLIAWMARHFLTDEAAVLAVALAVILGHLHSIFLGLKGGKGVATALGAILGLHVLLGVFLLCIWLLAVAVWRYSSGGALAAFGLFPVAVAWSRQSSFFLGFACVVSALIWLRHKENLVRLWSGTESRMGQPTKP